MITTLHAQRDRLIDERDALQARLTEMESVLTWASENVESLKSFDDNPKRWYAYWNLEHSKGDTLYQALLSAWKARGEKV